MLQLVTRLKSPDAVMLAIVSGSAASEPAAPVETVMIARTVCAPGVTDGGSNAHDVCGGRLPFAQLSVISLLYGPFCGAIVTTYVAVPPGDTVTLAGDTSK